MNVRFRPLRAWSHPDTKGRHSRYTFKAGWASTLQLLETELTHLGARDVVIEIDVPDTKIRLDGWPRSDANPVHPGVCIYFESRDQGALKFATDAFEFWQHNVRAIALGLEALRKVDRYGITHRGEQYTGWKALPPGSGGAPIGVRAAMTREEAAAFIAGTTGVDATALLDGTLPAKSVFRMAAKKLHPDAGGDPMEWHRLQVALELLAA